MARVTVEDCLEVVDNQYDLVILAKERTLQIGAGDKPMVSENNDKKTVLSLRELGDKKLDQKTLESQTIDRAREHPEDTLNKKSMIHQRETHSKKFIKGKFQNLDKQFYLQKDQEKFQLQMLRLMRILL